MKITKKIILAAFSLAFALSLISIATAAVATVCCQKTISGLYCQNVPASECAPDSKQVPTRCDYTSYCRPGICFNSNEGTCISKTSEFVCNMTGGIWSKTSPPQCELGCCVLADQAAFVTLTRCKKLSASLGLETNYKQNIKDEAQCVLSVQGQEKGACVYEEDFQKNCRFTTRAECTGISEEDKTRSFFKGRLCSDEELGTICGPTTNTICAPGKEEVYFVDTCGNIANIYDYNRRNDKVYWAQAIDKTESCNPNSANANSASCGNCNYLLGTFCRSSESAGARASIGDYICADLNCKKTSNGKAYKHGESWCVYTDAGKIGASNNAVGSRFYKHICINGEEVLEQCDDFRQQECIEATISTSVGTFSQAACRVNRWQDCTMQNTSIDCENTDRRDCKWMAEVGGACVPENSPGLKFWEDGEAGAVCGRANTVCEIEIEKDVFGKEKVVKNKECLGGGWLQARVNYCMALGDCGPKINWLGDKGNDQAYTYSAPEID